MLRNRKKLIVALTLGALAFAAVFAVAAPASLTPRQLAAGAWTAGGCDTTFATSYSTAYDATLGEYEVDRLTVSGIDELCDGSTMTAMFTDASNAIVGSDQSTTVATGGSGIQIITFARANVPLDEVVKVHLVIARS